VEALCQLSLALTRRPWVAGVTLVLFGAHAMVWGVVTVSLRQQVVPDRLRGRVNSVHFLFDLGGPRSARWPPGPASASPTQSGSSV
jgi:hypothetical protein